MSKQSNWGRLFERANRRVYVNRHGWSGMSEPPGELDREDALLVPEGGTSVTEQVWMHAGAGPPHSVPERGPFDTPERFKHRDDPRLDRYPPATTRLGNLRPDPDPQPGPINVVPTYGYGFADPHARVFKHNTSQPVTHIQPWEEGKEVVCVGGLWYHARRLWETDRTMAGWVLGDRIEDHPRTADIAGDGAGTQSLPDHVSDPVDDVGGGQ